MTTLLSILQVVVALGLLNVWLLRSRSSTAYRGGDAGSIQQEFQVYGLPPWSTYIVGTLKIAAALCLLAGLWLHVLVLPAALLLCVLMLGALAMHLKVHDPLRKSLPALAMLLLNAAIVLICLRWPLPR